MRCVAIFAFLVITCFPLVGQNRYDVQGPIEMHGRVTVKPGMGPSLEKVFLNDYYPAISSQPGFRQSSLLKVPGSQDQYVLTLAFDSEDLRLQWAKSEIHGKVWPKMLANYADNKVSAYSIVGPKKSR